MTKSLSKAIALATLVGAAASAQAGISVNPDGLGEVLLYSVYTAEEGNITNINITNTTNTTKAVKVRFFEGQNSREVLDFNLYLSPFDQWSGAVTTHEKGGAQLITADKSCTLPAIKKDGIAFRDIDYIGDGGNQHIERTLVGHLEAIEMGTIKDTPKYAKLINAVADKNCGVLEAAFLTGGLWENDPSDGLKVQPENQNGGLYGVAEIMNVEESTVISYDATALQGLLIRKGDGTNRFATGGDLHARPGSIYPNLNGNVVKPTPAQNGVSDSRTTNWADIDSKKYEFPSTVQAVGAVLAKNAIHNNYVIDEGRASKSNWVVTFPTKRFHVDATMENGLNALVLNNYKDPIQILKDIVTASENAHAAALAGTDAGAIFLTREKLEHDRKALTALVNQYANAVAPFTELWTNGKACEDIKLSAWNNDELQESDLDFSPSRPSGPQFCYETNIVTFNDGKVFGGDWLSENIELDPALFPYGWMNVDFSDKHLSKGSLATIKFGLDIGIPEVVYGDGDRIVGLPVIGLSAANFRNNSAKPGVNNIYTSSSNHKATKAVDAPSPLIFH